MSKFNHANPCISIIAVASVLAGCEVAQDPQVIAYRTKFLMPQEPANASSIGNAKKHLADRPEVVLIGQIGIRETDLIEKHKAMFLISDVSTDGHDHVKGHDPDNCPFCKRKAAESDWAAVQFVDGRGQVVPIGVEKLFGIRKGDVVVIRGQGELNEALNMFCVTADRIHIRR